MEHNKFETKLPDLLQEYLSHSLGLVKPDADHTEVIRGWEERAGFELKRTEQVKRIPNGDFAHRLNGLNRDLPEDAT